MDVLYGFGMQVCASLCVRGRWCGTSDLAIRQYGISHHISKSLCTFASVFSMYLLEIVWIEENNENRRGVCVAIREFLSRFERE